MIRELKLGVVTPSYCPHDGIRWRKDSNPCLPQSLDHIFIISPDFFKGDPVCGLYASENPKNFINILKCKSSNSWRKKLSE